MRIAIVHYHLGPGGVAEVIRASLPSAEHVILVGEGPADDENLPLRIVEPRFKLPPLVEAIQWHRFSATDQALMWVRDQIVASMSIQAET